jgi:hypothetical protein
MQKQVSPESVVFKMSMIPAKHRRFCGYNEETGEYAGSGPCACSGCAPVSLEDFKQWVKDGKQILHFPVRFKVRPDEKLKAVKFVMENHSINAKLALEFIERGVWSPGMSYDSFSDLRYHMHDLFTFELVCPNDSNKDGDCQFCHKDHSCPMKQP